MNESRGSGGAAPPGRDKGREMADRWAPELTALARAIRRPVRSRLAEVAAGEARRGDVARAVGQGVGDVTFALDAIAEAAVDGWLEEVARRLGPVSLLTEDAGWRHAGIEPGSVGTDPFDHGGPRIALDPIDGTRNLMHDLRSAWVVVSFAAAGPGEPTFDDLVLGLVSELPDTRARVGRELIGTLGAGASVTTFDCGDGTMEAPRPLRADTSPRLDHGYLPFFGYHPRSRRHVQALCGEVVERLAAADPSLDVSTLFDDQYISSGGQLALLALGTYRGVVDARHTLGKAHRLATQTAKPYDMAGAALVAREAGCVVNAPDGSPLRFALDAVTPVDFAGFHNPAVAARVQPCLTEAIEALPR